MLDFKKMKVVDRDEYHSTGYDKYFWVFGDVVISPLFEGFNKACRFEYNGEYAFNNTLCCLYRMPSMYSKICMQMQV